MTRWLLSALLLTAAVGWLWLAHGVLWSVPPGAVRVAATPTACAEPLAFSRARGEAGDLSFIDMQTTRQLARSLGAGSIDVAIVDVEALAGEGFRGTDTRLLALLECEDGLKAAATARAAPARVAEVFMAAWERGVSARLAHPEAYLAHVQRRQRKALPADAPRLIPATDRAGLEAVLSTRGMVAKDVLGQLGGPG